ncbi:ATP-dependent DNA helicase Rep [Klebsiella pneumoniae]|uniref:ATP-dependent DNA helicase Rep n=1 Tax=Klebsiella pneumoniae TaxID=573 RepID=A0A377ZS65_KLEPN|nr:ATP-dependent DNA helicase Rep [Klebsiella pneumoniae]
MLMQNRIPYKISGGTSFFSRPEIKDLLAYLRVLTNPDDGQRLPAYRQHAEARDRPGDAAKAR